MEFQRKHVINLIVLYAFLLKLNWNFDVFISEFSVKRLLQNIGMKKHPLSDLHARLVGLRPSVSRTFKHGGNSPSFQRCWQMDIEWTEYCVFMVSHTSTLSNGSGAGSLSTTNCDNVRPSHLSTEQLQYK